MPSGPTDPAQPHAGCCADSLLDGAGARPGWVAVLTPLSVDGMIVAASTTLLSDSRSGSRGGVLPWALLVVGSVASLIGRQYGRHERWGRLVKRAGTAGEFSVGNAPDDRCGDKEEVLAAAAT